MKKSSLMVLLKSVPDDATVVFCVGDSDLNKVVRIGSVTEEMIVPGEDYIDEYPEGESGYEKAVVLWA